MKILTKENYQLFLRSKPQVTLHFALIITENYTLGEEGESDMQLIASLKKFLNLSLKTQ